MAWSSAAVPAAEIALRQDDKPILVGSNVLRDNLSEEWRTGGSPIATELGQPISRAYDGQGVSVTQPDNQGAVAEYSLVFELASGAVFDSFAMIGHNLTLLNPTVGFTVTLANDSAISVNTEIIFASPAITVERKVDYTLGAGGEDRFTVDSGLAFVRFQWTTTDGGGFGSTVPRVGELILGRRRQMPFKSDLSGFDESRLDARSADFESRSGLTTRFTHFKGRSKLDISWMPDETAKSVDQIEDLRQWYKEADFGQKVSLYTEDPSSDPAKSFLMFKESGGLNMPLRFYATRNARVGLKEQPPFYAIENP